LHHGLANAICLVEVMRWNAERQPGLYARVGTALGLDPQITDQADDPIIEWVAKLIDQCGIQTGLRHHGVKQEQLNDLADLAIKDSCHQTNPVPMNREDFLTLYQRCL